MLMYSILAYANKSRICCDYNAGIQLKRQQRRQTVSRILCHNSYIEQGCSFYHSSSPSSASTRYISDRSILAQRTRIIEPCYNKGSSFRVMSKCLFYLLSRRSRQRQRLGASVLSTCLSVSLSVCRQNAKNVIFSKTKQFRAMISIVDLQEVM